MWKEYWNTVMKPSLRWTKKYWWQYAMLYVGTILVTFLWINGYVEDTANNVVSRFQRLSR